MASLLELKRLLLVVEGLLNQEEPNALLLQGRRALEGFQEVELCEDLSWDPRTSKWVLFCSIYLDVIKNAHITKTTMWYVLISPEYPLGEISFYPAINGGIEATFPHQNHNGYYNDDRPWRKGKLCLDASVSVLGRNAINTEPQNVDRLLWHFTRAIDWIKFASAQELTSIGDPYELPSFPKESNETIVFSESPTTLWNWLELKKTYGVVKFSKMNSESNIWLSKEYLVQNKSYYQPKWGTLISDLDDQTTIGIWIKLYEAPVIAPWQVPHTWEELQKTLLIQGINLIDIIKDAAHLLRDGKHHYITLGFPIPEYVGENAMVMNWQGIKLPILSHGKLFAKGFRKDELGYWQRDRTVIFRKHEKVSWTFSENWNRNEILNRGRMDSGITQSAVLQIGAGSLGSMIAEQLVRADLQKLHIVDYDLLEAGNLVRHTLDMNSLNKNKALALSKKLNTSVPHSKVRGYAAHFPSEQLDYTNYRVILDCSGEDDVIYKLQMLPLTYPKVFISVSLGYAAKRLFFYTHKTNQFSPDTFFKMLSPWIEKERDGYREDDLPRDGIGCWHPVFPARIDDVWLMSAVVIKGIEKYILNPANNPTLLIYEQIFEEGLFSGVKLVHKEEWHD